MSQTYKFKSLQIANEEKKQIEASEKLTVFEVGETKTIDFISLDGTRQNFSYVHYITSWLGKEGEGRVIKIFFATHLVTIKGYCLDDLYDELIKQSVKSIKAHNERYVDAVEENKVFVINIKVSCKKSK